MQQTIYGETPKKKKTHVHERKDIDSFMKINGDKFRSLGDKNNCLYSKNSQLISDPVANYLNLKFKKNIDKVLKSILAIEYSKLEKVYPKLGFYFLEKYFNKDIEVSKKDYFLHEDNLKVFLDTIESRNVKNIIESLVHNSSLEYSVEVLSHLGKEVILSKNKNINFKLDYDTTFLGRKSNHAINNFKYIIIDGQIESIGEVYHLLYKAAETKVPYVVFCFGMANEVKDVILQNNSKGLTEIMPVVLKFNESTINVLADLSAVLGGDVVTAQKGQTISQEVRKTLPTGKSIEFYRTGFKIEPSVSDSRIDAHRKMLTKRIENGNNETNIELLIQRKRRMSNKNLKIFIPDSILKKPKFSAELDYAIRFFSNSTYMMKKVKHSNQESFYFLPDFFLSMVEKKVESIGKIYKNLDKVIIHQQAGD